MFKSKPHPVETGTATTAEKLTLVAEKERLLMIKSESEAQLDRLIKSGRFEDKDVLDQVVFHKNRLEMLPHRIDRIDSRLAEMELEAGVAGDPIGTINGGLRAEGMKVLGQRIGGDIKKYYPGGDVPPEVIENILPFTTFGLRLEAVDRRGGYGSAGGWLGGLEVSMKTFYDILDAFVRHDVPIPSEHKAVWEARAKK